MTVSAVWTIADIFNGLMAIPNIDRSVCIKRCHCKGDKGLLRNEETY